MKAPLFLSLLLLMAACGGNKKEQAQSADTAAIAPPSPYDSILTANFYKRLEGTIAGQPVVMHLQSTNGMFEGIYYYQNYGTWIEVSGTLDKTRPNKLEIRETSFEGEVLAVMDCQYEQGAIKGSWRSNDGKKNYLVDLRENYPEGAYAFTAFIQSDSLAAFEGDTASPVAHVVRSFPIPLNNDDAGKWLDASIKRALYVDTSLMTLDIMTAAKKMNGKYLKSYRDEVKSMKPDEEDASFMNYEDLQNISVCYNDNGYVILNASKYSYSGGAHGNGGSSFHCLDVLNRKELKLRDILNADSAQLQPVVEAAFRKEQGLKPTDSLTDILFENHLATTDNFYFTGKGIGFYYFPYEVAAYAVGPIHVFVPFTSLKAYLHPVFVQRMKLRL